MANVSQVKNDVINELKNRLYYNQLEIQRLLNNPAGVSHKEVVDTIVLLLSKNVEAQNSIELIEAYLPPQQPAKEVSPAPQDEAVQKVD